MVYSTGMSTGNFMRSQTMLTSRNGSKVLVVQGSAYLYPGTTGNRNMYSVWDTERKVVMYPQTTLKDKALDALNQHELEI